MSQLNKSAERHPCEAALSKVEGSIPATSAHRSECALSAVPALTPSMEFTPREAQGLRSGVGTRVESSAVPESRKQLRDTGLVKCRTFIQHPGTVGPEINSAEGRDARLLRPGRFCVALVARRSPLVTFAARARAASSWGPRSQPRRPMLIANRGSGELTNVSTH